MLWSFAGMANTHSKPISLKEKIGQMLIIGFDGKRVAKTDVIANDIINNNLGGVILFDFNYQTQTFDKNIESPEQVNRLNSDLQSFAFEGNQKHNRPLVPLFISVDYEGGKVNRLHERYGFPKTQSAKTVAQDSINEAKQSAKIMGSVLQSSGFNMDFAPVVDVEVNPDNPVIGQLERSYSDNPSIVSLYSTIFSNALEKKGIACVYKHFPGHGSSTKDSHLGFVDVTDTWQSYELLPYKEAIKDGTSCPMIMTAHIINKNLDPQGLPATLSKKILTNLLRGELKYQGVIVTDDMQMKAISDNYGLETAVVRAINAGADILVFGNQLSDRPVSASRLIEIIANKVEHGLISEKRINDSYQRILMLKRNISA